ncbi:Mu transposase domain-containing protein [Streptomyces sp. NPDC004135]
MPSVDRFTQISVRGNTYSVPVGFIGRQLRVLLHANELIVYDGRAVVTRHEPLGGRDDSRLVLDHYLEAPLRKPGAFPGSTALEQARSAGRFTPVHDMWWAAAKAAHGDAAGTRALIEVLLLGRHMDHEQVVAGLAAAYRAGALTADAVALEARQLAESDGDTALPARPDAEPAPTADEGPTASVTFLADADVFRTPRIRITRAYRLTRARRASL